MENANVHLDRYGLPEIPGSAIKGCARRMALQALHDWVAAQDTKGSNQHPAEDDACGPCCVGFVRPAEMLAAIARVFGWTTDDWSTRKKDGRFVSDFAWASHGSMDILTVAGTLNPAHSTFAGSVAFLAATPNRDPGLEMDVVTPHHTRYHKGERGYESAPDTEDPVPVFFPAVRAQGETEFFTFPLIPLRSCLSADLRFASTCLAHGLELLGLGAKTNAGYGWFDSSTHQQEKSQKSQAAAEEAEKQRIEKEKNDARRKREAESERIRRAVQAAVMATLTDDQKDDFVIGQLTEGAFENKVRNFFKEPKKGGPSENERKAIIRALRGNRLDFWQKFKESAKSGDPAKALNAIIALNKNLNGDKMP
jgi:CRISPR type III-B/RAMP module RAMP protein Cmr6